MTDPENDDTLGAVHQHEVDGGRLGRSRAKEKLIQSRVDGLVKAWVVKGRIMVSAPYRDRFKETARALCGQYQPRLRIWSFPLDNMRAVREAVESIYGADKVPPILTLD